ncbi:MAG: hypothetical protein A2255_04970 [Candidatus Melainabacteria bacterium RIFOXYA2_FULL_32_9]|nr:MAG: hypothetical protein A2255_04970 [Candidatus Melainabacteria bacterium RIFOXYA2_FULL_32_9]
MGRFRWFSPHCWSRCISYIEQCLIHTWLSNPACDGSRSSLTKVCARIFVDVNGFKKPNITGKDILVIHLVDQGIKPGGTQGDGYSCTTTSDGWGCAAAYLLDNQ